VAKKKEMTKKEVGFSTPVPDEQQDYMQWLIEVPIEERERMAALLVSYKIEDYPDLIGFTQAIMAEIIRGNLSLLVAQELRYWAEMLFTMVAAENSAAGTPEAAGQNIITALMAVSQTVQVEPIVPERIVLKAQEGVVDG